MAVAIGLLAGPAAGQGLMPLTDAPALSPLPPLAPGRARSGPQAPMPLPATNRVRWMRPPQSGSAKGAEDERPTEHAVIAAPRPPKRPAKVPSPVQQQFRAGIEQSALIGVMDLSTGRTALMMLPDGAIRRVGVGDTIGGWRIASIASDAVRVTRGGQFRTLLLLSR